MRASVIQSVSVPPEEAQRIGVYVLAALVGLLVTGIIACASEFRRDLADRKLRKAEDAQATAGAALKARSRALNTRSA